MRGHPLDRRTHAAYLSPMKRKAMDPEGPDYAALLKA